MLGVPEAGGPDCTVKFPLWLSLMGPLRSGRFILYFPELGTPGLAFLWKQEDA